METKEDKVMHHAAFLFKFSITIMQKNLSACMHDYPRPETDSRGGGELRVIIMMHVPTIDTVACIYNHVLYYYRVQLPAKLLSNGRC